jgi:ribosomal protein S21
MLSLVEWLTMSIQVTRKDAKEANENIIRRFNRRVLQSGVIANAKATERFEKPISKTERRKKAIIRDERKAEKIMAIKLGK